MPHASTETPFRSAICPATATAPGSSTISIAIVVPVGLLGDQTLAFASWKKPRAVFASSTERMCGRVTPSAPAASTSLTRVRVSSTPSRSMVGIRTSSVLRGPAPVRSPSAIALTAGQIVAALEVEEHEVEERVGGQLRAALFRVDPLRWRLAALEGLRILVGHEHAEGRLARVPEIEHGVRSLSARGSARHATGQSDYQPRTDNSTNRPHPRSLSRHKAQGKRQKRGPQPSAFVLPSALCLLPYALCLVPSALRLSSPSRTRTCDCSSRRGSRAASAPRETAASRCTGPLAMSAVVCPSRLTRVDVGALRHEVGDHLDVAARRRRGAAAVLPS